MQSTAGRCCCRLFVGLDRAFSTTDRQGRPLCSLHAKQCPPTRPSRHQRPNSFRNQYCMTDSIFRRDQRHRKPWRRSSVARGIEMDCLIHFVRFGVRPYRHLAAASVTTKAQCYRHLQREDRLQTTIRDNSRMTLARE